MSGPDDFYQSDLSTLPLGVDAPPATSNSRSWVPSLLKSGARGVIPATGGFAGAIAGAQAGGGLGLLGGPFAEITSPAGALLGGVAGAFGGGYLADKAQTGIADAVTDGGFSRDRARDQAEHPYASMIGETVPNLLFLRPSTNLAPLARGFGAAFGGGLEAGTEYSQTGQIDPGKVAIQAGAGALMDSETAIGRSIAGRTHALVSSIDPGIGATIERIGANATLQAALRDVPDADRHVADAATAALDPNLSAATREALVRSRALQAALGDRRTPDEVAAGHVTESNALDEASSPFVPSPEAAQIHGDNLAAATQGLLDDAPAPIPDPRQAVADWQHPEIRRDSWHWAVKQQESGGNHMAVSPRGAKGAMQVMDATARDPGYGVAPAKDDSWQERDRVGDQLLDAYAAHYGNELLGTAAYNAGPARVDKWLRTIGDPRTGAISYADFAQRIPIKETRDYVREVYRRMAKPIPATPLVRPELVGEGGAPSVPGIPDDPALAGESWDDALTRMMVTESGGAARALWHPDIGEIDVPWGEAGTGESDGYGLAKLERFHPEVLRDLPEIVAGMDVVSQSANRVRLASRTGQAAVSLNWQGDPARPWLLTAYDRETPAPAVDERAGAAGPDGSPDLGAAPDIGASAPKRQSRPRAPRTTRKPAGPVDALSFLADRGGLADDEGHDLQGRGRLISGAISGQRRRGGSAGIGLPTFAPGGGFLFRKGGLSLDEAGELLHEAGYFPGEERPTTAEVLDMLAASNVKPVYRPQDVADAHFAELEARYGPEPIEDGPLEVPAFDGPASEAQGVAAFDEPVGEGARIQVQDIEHDLRMEIASDASGFITAKGSTYVVHEDGTTTRNKSARDDAGHEGDAGEKPRSLRTVYVQGDASSLSAAGLDGLGPKGARVIIRDNRASLLTWNEREGRWGFAPSGRGIEVSDRPSVGASPLELWKKADDVPGYEAYANMHAGNRITDIHAAALDRGAEADPAIADRQRQQAELGAAAPLRAPAEQDGTMGLGLFDAANQPEFRLDEEGGTRSAADILAQADADEQAAASIRACLIPPKGAA